MARADEKLVEFVQAALAKGIPRSEISSELKKAGWPAEQISEALRSFAESDFALPVPRPKPYLSARESFLYLLMFAALYASAFYLGDLVFQIVNTAFPDPAVEDVSRYARDIRYAIAVIIPFFTVYVFLSIKMGRMVRADSTKRVSPIRKWLTHLTILVGVIVVLCDLAGLIYNFLIGALTVRTALKILTIGVIAGAVIGYYLNELRRDDEILALDD